MQPPAAGRTRRRTVPRPPVGLHQAGPAVSRGLAPAISRHTRPDPAAAARPPMSPRLLMIDDDARLAGMVVDYLGAAGFDVRWAASLAAGRAMLAQQPVDALVLDLMLPDGDGLDLCRELRAAPATRGLPVLVLSARGEPTDRIVGLELGADDYLAKPFEPRELLARVKALLRRAAPPSTDDEVMRFGRLAIDLGARVAQLDGRPCDLTSHQFDLLVLLARHAGRVLSRDQIMDGLKGHAAEAFDRSIDVHVSRIRAVIEDDPRAPQRLRTVRGAGYVFVRHQDGEGAGPGGVA
jgi:two-component system, OmpR family, phosphate regulon response regulator OmpR